MTANSFQMEKVNGDAIFSNGTHRLRLRFVTDLILRSTFTTVDRSFTDKPSRIVLPREGSCVFADEETPTAFVLTTSRMRVEVSRSAAALRCFDHEGKLLMQEPARGGKWLTARTVTRNVFDQDTEVETGQSIDGARAVATAYTTVFDRIAFEAKLEFVFQEDEALFGLGSHEEGFGNLRGRSRELYQQNMKAVVPHLVSTRGYGVLLDCCSLMTFHDDALGSYWWADCVEELDYYVIAGPTYGDVLLGYRDLTGKPPLPPKWTFGYVQSKERYVTAEEMLDVVKEYRRRQVPLDVIVLDWKSWPNGSGWGQKTLDPLRFPDPQAFTDALHQMGGRLMISVWPIMTGGCPDQRALLDRDLMLGNRSTYDAFLPEARAMYWDQAERGLFQLGVDAWWCDCTEPFEADWAGAVKPEPHARLALNTAESKLYLDPGEINAYSLLHAQGLYEGQRRASTSKRVLNLTRSSYAGQSRYGTVTWNGDVSATWETLRRSIAEGLNFCATGEPYWTVDIGGFFVDHNPKLWFWRGDYPDGTRGLTGMDALAPDLNDTGSLDLGFRELYTRWLQYAVFLPMFRSHGTDVSREIWRFGEEGNPFYDAIALNIRLRYRLVPFLYSLAADISFGGGYFLCALALEFPGDLACSGISDQFLLGSSLMVCPVAFPMLYGPGSEPLKDVSHCRSVYLPLCAGWYDFWTGAYLSSGQALLAPAPLDRIPVYARAGSIVVLGQVMQFVDEVPDAPFELHVYSGQDAAFLLYEDAGDAYDYEQGACARVAINWQEREQTLTLSARKGSFPTLVQERVLRIVLYSPNGQQRQDVTYNGAEAHVYFDVTKENA